MREILLTVFAIAILCTPIFGLITGLLRYKKHSKEVKSRVDAEYKAAREKGGVASLYYKHPERRLFKRTFGLPMLIAFVVEIVLLFILFKLI